MPSLVCFLVILLSLIVYLQGYSLPKLRSPSGLRATRAKVQSLEVTKTVTATKPVKYIVVTGGVISGIGKGVTASSIGVILKMIGVRPTAIKIDPYLNVDAGTMSPSEHGEVFVLDDGSETDLDLGNYERFLDVRLTNDSNLTTGKVYASVIARERRGDYLGKTVQIIPHITNEIIDRIASVSTQSVDDTKLRPDVCIIELGGTIGDIESMAFVEALRQLQLRVAREDFCLLHVSMVPSVGEGGEQKTKPTQHSVKELRALGLAPDFVVCRSQTSITQDVRDKISLFCNVPAPHVFAVRDVPNIYHVPLVLLDQDFDNLIAERLHLSPPTRDEQSRDRRNTAGAQHQAGPIRVDAEALRRWKDMTEVVDKATEEAVVALVGKYTSQSDAYLSVISALKHACISTNQRLKLLMIESADLDPETSASSPEKYTSAWEKLRAADAVLVPGGFGVRGIDGKVAAIRYAREAKVPFLGICLGMQAAVIEYARNILGRPVANSREFDESLPEQDCAVVFMPEGDRENKGGTMRLGARRTMLRSGSLASELYDSAAHVEERHRHRYEVNPGMVNALEAVGLAFTGKDERGERMEIVELPAATHPYFLGVQFHPEFLSRPGRPAPVFLGLLRSAKTRRAEREGRR